MKPFRSLLLAAIAAMPLLAQPLRVGAPARVAPFRLGAADGTQQLLGVVPSGGGETVYWEVSELTAAGPTTRVDSIDLDPNGNPIQATYRSRFQGDDVRAFGATSAGPLLVRGGPDVSEVRSLGADGTFSISNDAGSGTAEAMVCGSVSCVVAFNPWEVGGSTAPADIVDTTGHVTARIAIPLYAYRTGAADTSGFVLLGEDNAGTTHAVRVTTGGSVAWDITFPTFPPLGKNPVIAFDGDHYAVLWANPDAGQTYTSTLTTGGFLVVPPTPQNYYSGQPVSLTWNGSRYLLLSEEVVKGTPGVGTYRATVRVMRLGSSLNPLDIAPIDLGTGWTNASPAAVWNGSRFFVARGAGLVDGSGGQLFATTMGPASAPSVPSLIAYGAIAQRNAQVARTNGQAIVVWPEYDALSDTTTIRLSRILPGNDVTFTKELVTGNVTLLATAAAGPDILTVWKSCESASSCDVPSIAGIIARGDGSLKSLSLTGVGLQNGVALAGNTNGWLLAGTQPGGSLLSSVSIARDGSTSPIHLYPHGGTNLSMASDGSGFALVSRQQQCASPSVCATSLTMITPDGSTLRDQAISNLTGDSIVFNGERYAVRLSDGSGQTLAFFDTNGNGMGVSQVMSLIGTPTVIPTFFGSVGTMWIVGVKDVHTMARSARLFTSDGTFISEIPFEFDAVAGSPDGKGTAVGSRDDVFAPYAGAPALFSSEIDARVPQKRRALR